MAAKRAFISFDFEHDEDLRNLLVGQAKNPDSPFSVQDWSLREPLSGNWKAGVRDRIRRTDVTVVICGEHTNSATGVSVELDITRDEGNPFFLLHGRRDKQCQRPRSAQATDKMYRWTWENLKRLIGGAR
ncbi:MAG: TIR domain-containing protein [Chloroflexota bacterium]|nr:TIR domain-containing protein [Chloroflexota bacterium]